MKKFKNVVKFKKPKMKSPTSKEMQIFMSKFIAMTFSLFISIIVYYLILQVALQCAFAVIAESMTAVDINANTIYIIMASSVTMSLMTIAFLKIPVYSWTYKKLSSLLIRGEKHENN